MLTGILVAVSLLVLVYLWHVNRALSSTPEDLSRLTQPRFTKQEIQEAYRRVQTNTIDVKPFLFGRKDRRYIVVGGSGFVGTWIVQHLLMRGEDPSAIRIIDILPPKRQAILEKDIQFIQTDVSDHTAVQKAFQTRWPEQVTSLPLTVFHCVAYISPSDRTYDFIPRFEKVNIQGTQNVIEAARTAGTSILIATSSSTVGLVAPSLFAWPWQSHPTNFWQLVPNADRDPLLRPLKDYSSCYAWSKARAEAAVRAANDPNGGFLTGSIRPGHVIYGHGGAHEWSISWDYLRRGGTPSWIHHIILNAVNVQNVSIAHLAYENALLTNPSPTTHSLAGSAYAVTDSNPPIRYADIYDTLSHLAHPSTPVRFPKIPPLTLLLPSYPLEWYRLLRIRIPWLKFLPELRGDILKIMPTMYQMCTVHTVITDDKAREEIGYAAPIGTLEGLAMAVVEWNGEVERDLAVKSRRGQGVDVGNPRVVSTGSVVR